MRSRIEKRNGYVFEVVGSKVGFETWFNVGKDPDDPKWNQEAEIEKVEEEVSAVPKKKSKKTVIETEEQKESEA